MFNLLNNALCYSDDGASVTIHGARRDDALALTFEDTGWGIPEQDLPHIFKKFYRSKPHARRVKGTGLGLPLVLEIVKSPRRLHRRTERACQGEYVHRDPAPGGRRNEKRNNESGMGASVREVVKDRNVPHAYLLQRPLRTLRENFCIRRRHDQSVDRR